MLWSVLLEAGSMASFIHGRVLEPLSQPGSKGYGLENVVRRFH